ncbi:uncharacterized protein LOC115009753 [Cottoperca gobio]|uniref:Uncharacterized protein LOC115009753 n=1 Tax=Cottoperca gobio TaxID=56716 RepID=A0A6J2PWL6_COTGO|nr:uncharacterized protein LOC115009753 [Cottoperca gobio]
MAVKRTKYSELPGGDAITSFLDGAKLKIPQLLDELEEEYTNNLRFRLYGFMCGYWSCVFGHRPGVYSNMTDTEYTQALASGGEQGYLIHVKEHKTNKSFGEAQLVLTGVEFGWLQRWMAIKNKVPKKEKNTFVMFTKGTGPCKNLNNCLRMAWAELRIGGNISFTLIRTALAHYAKKTTDVTARKRVADFMCHDVTTADRFYARCPDVTEAMAIRCLIRDSLRTEERAGPSTAVVASFTPLGGRTCVEESSIC